MPCESSKTSRIYDTGHGYGDACLYHCKNSAQIGYRHTAACPWVVFNAQPDVKRAVVIFVEEQKRAAEALRQEALRVERDRDLQIIDQLRRKHGIR